MNQPFALIIEDNRDLAILFSKTLQWAGFETETIQNGSQAQSRLRQLNPNVVVLDLHLPLVSGDVLLKQIRSDRRLDNTRVLLLTADALTAAYLNDQVDLVLLKPVSPEQLSELTKRLVPKTAWD